MNLLLFSDLHDSRPLAQSVVARASIVDVVVGAGDFGNMRRDVDDCIAILKEIERPTILVAGNNESTDELRAACRKWSSAYVLHGTLVHILGITFFGIGGGVPVTPFGAWSYDFTEEQAGELLATCPAGAALISHSPPKGAVDRSSRGNSLGSTAVREAIVRTRPRLVVCGHIHASGGKTEHIDGVPVVNAGPHAVIWKLANAT
jgi:Icc-related predicted phosphoesterase